MKKKGVIPIGSHYTFFQRRGKGYWPPFLKVILNKGGALKLLIPGEVIMGDLLLRAWKTSPVGKINYFWDLGTFSYFWPGRWG